MIQQGDVTLLRLQALPVGEAKTLSRGRCVLAEGEHTGHHHIIEDDEAELIRIGEKMLLKLGKAAVLKHEEHYAITIPAGIWEVGQVHEYDYLAEMARTVRD